MDKKLIFLLVIVLLLAGWAGVWFFTKKTPPGQNGSLDTASWTTYKNEPYGFELKHPADWQVLETEQITVPMINIYRKGEEIILPLTHHSDATHVSIYPRGIPTEGVFSQTSTSSVEIGPKIEQIIDFVLADGTAWATAVYFEEDPPSWDPWGFVWAGLKIQNHTEKCLREGQVIAPEKCDPLFGDEIVHYGQINSKDRKIEEEILKSFRFK